MPKGMTGTPCRGADAHDLLHVLGGLRKHHRVRRLVGDPGERIAVLLAHRLRGDDAIAEGRGEFARRSSRSPPELRRMSGAATAAANGHKKYPLLGSGGRTGH